MATEEEMIHAFKAAIENPNDACGKLKTNWAVWRFHCEIL